METSLYTVYDSKAEAYLQPFHARTRGEAIRNFTEAVNDPKSMFNRYPADYTLFEIGTWDDQEGSIKQHTAKQNLGLAIQYKRVEDNQEEVPNGKTVSLADQRRELTQ